MRAFDLMGVASHTAVLGRNDWQSVWCSGIHLGRIGREDRGTYAPSRLTRFATGTVTVVVSTGLVGPSALASVIKALQYRPWEWIPACWGAYSPALLDNDDVCPVEAQLKPETGIQNNAHRWEEEEELNLSTPTSPTPPRHKTKLSRMPMKGKTLR
ncbi:hypothetical protein CLAIMM_12319 isoform 2 [Cladophialophora immunda]|nr:hypothetical protein CLAIMM_12319 isoform 1 [Cladophialophora immunda]OQV07971.1 hypothetical protein CLAIMM_12319 isoform 2 [Cladophialophora immunda]